MGAKIHPYADRLMGAKGPGSPSGVSPESHHGVHGTEPGQTQKLGKLAQLVIWSPPYWDPTARCCCDAQRHWGLQGGALLEITDGNV